MLDPRYLRQIILSDIGVEGQACIGNAKILCVGIGGLGSPVLIYLATSGVGTIGIIDMDVVSTTDLHRQIIFNSSDVGKKKVVVAKSYINILNPDIIINEYDCMLTDNNANEIFCFYDIVVDCTDNLKAKFLINNYAVKFNIPMVYGAVYGFEGHVAIFYHTHGACYSCLYNDIQTSYVPNCSEHGVLGPITGIIGSIQAIEVIKLILYLKLNSNISNLISKLCIFNLRDMQFKLLHLKKKKNCNICYDNYHKKEYINNSIIVDENKKLYVYKSELYKVKKINIIDISEKSEIFSASEKVFFNILKVPFSFFLNFENLDKIIKPDFVYVIVCEYGIKSKLICKYLRLKGFKSIFYLILDI